MPIAYGHIPNTVLRVHTLFTFPTGNDFISGKIKIFEMWVERLLGEWTATSIPMFATEWSGFHKLIRDPSLMIFSLVLLLVVGHGIFTSTILNYRKFVL